MIDEKFIRKRITKLRMQKDVSEYKMSLDMGHSGSYINSMGEFLYMCDYLGVSPSEFFDEEIETPIKIAEIDEILRKLDESDLDLILTTAKRLAKK